VVFYFYSRRCGLSCIVFCLGPPPADEQHCHFPFTYKGITYDRCTIRGKLWVWCSLHRHYQNKWAYCRREGLLPLLHYLYCKFKLLLNENNSNQSVLLIVCFLPIKLFNGLQSHETDTKRCCRCVQ